MSKIRHFAGKIKRYLIRNRRTMGGDKIVSNQIVLEWWSAKQNIGDVLSEVVYKWMLERESLDPLYKPKKIIHLSIIGSIIGFGRYDSVVWGSGVLGIGSIYNICRQSAYRKYDVRAVRGPLSEKILKSCGYQTNGIYGDPAILMPLIYMPDAKEKKYEVSVILHYLQKETSESYMNSDIHFIDVVTDNYKKFISEIAQSKQIISSSLHGIILAETYGVPAIFLQEGMDGEMLKFYDWYLSTNRSSIKVAKNIEEALQMEPMELPDLDAMRNKLIESFPRDLWEK